MSNFGRPSVFKLIQLLDVQILKELSNSWKLLFSKEEIRKDKVYFELYSISIINSIKYLLFTFHVCCIMYSISDVPDGTKK
jgi:hypothetical protein